MVHITDEVLARLARSSRLAVVTDARERVVAKLDAVLSYAAQLAQIQRPAATDIQAVAGLVLRSDTARPSIANSILQGAPLQIERYFVVPVVIAQESK